MRCICCTVSMIASTVVLGFSAIPLSAQTLFLNPPRESIHVGETLTFNLMVDQGIGRAVAWGTEITLPDPSLVSFVSDFGGANQPFRPAQAFFDGDFSTPFTPGQTSLRLNFLSLTPDTVLGNDNYVLLGQFQVQMLRDPGLSIPQTQSVLLADLGIPPYGSAVFDEDGNNLLIAVNGGSVTGVPPNPEPSIGVFALAAGIAARLLLWRKRKA